MVKLPGYAELHCRSNFSFLTGASHPAELVERAKALRYSALAITDECSLAGAVRAHVAAREAGLHLIIGSEIRLHWPASISGGPGAPHARLVLLAQTRRGYGNLSHWISVARRRASKGHYLAHPGDLEGKAPNAATLAGLHRGIAGAAHTDPQGLLRVEVDERPDEEPPGAQTRELERDYRAVVE